MTDSRYDVALQLRMEDELSSGMRTALGHAQGLASMFENMVDSAISLGARVGVLVGGLGFGLLAQQAHSVATSMESAQIGMAAILRANGGFQTFPAAMKEANKLMNEIGEDAAKLPGETSDLITIFQAIANPGLRNGVGTEQLRQISSNLMAFGIGVANLPAEVIAREGAMLMERGATMHNVLGVKLGLTGANAEKFNALDQAGKIAKLSEELGKFQGSIDAFSNSYSGLSSTFKDNVLGKNGFITQGYGPLLERIKGALKEANAWFDDHKEVTARWATWIGRQLTHAWDVGRQKIEEWWPVLVDFAHRASVELANIWARVEPYLVRAEDAVKSFMQSGSAFDKIEGVLKLWAGIKGFNMMGGFGTLSSAGSALFGGNGLTAGLAAATGLGEVTIAANVLLPALIAVGGALRILADDSNKYHDEAVAMLSSQADQLGEAMARLDESTGKLAGVSSALDGLGMALIKLASTEMGEATLILDHVAEWFEKIHQKAVDWKLIPGALTKTEDEKVARKWDTDLHLGGAAAYTNYLGGETNAKAAAMKGVPAQIKVDKIELVVTTNQDPLRVAEAVVSKMRNLDRHPSISKNVRNFSQTP